MIPGLSIVPSFVSEAEERALIELIGWSRDRAPHSQRNRIDRYCTDKIPEPFARLCDRLIDLGLVSMRPPSISVNEYRKGQGIVFHVDTPQSGDVISILGLHSDAVMLFMRGWTGGDPSRGCAEFSLPFPRRALVQIQGECRRLPWLHAIPPVTEDRISIVFRGVLNVRPAL